MEHKKFEYCLVPPSSVLLGRIVGIALCMMAWIVSLAGFAKCVAAAVHNKQGELGIGIDATMQGAELFLIAFGIGLVGVPLWVLAELKLKQKELELTHTPNYIPLDAAANLAAEQREAL